MFYVKPYANKGTSMTTLLFCKRVSCVLLMAFVGACANNKPVDEGPELSGSASTFGDRWSQLETDETELIGDTHYASGELDKALYQYLQALREHPKSALLYYKIGRVHRRAGKLDLAAQAFSNALQLQPDNIETLQAAGFLALKRRSLPAAKKLLQLAIDIDKRRFDAELEPDLDKKSPAKAYTGLGLIADLEGRHPRARGYFGTALQIKPGSPAIANNIGYSWYLSGRWSEAERYFKRALQLDNNYTMARQNLALLFVRTDRVNDAVTILWKDRNRANIYNTLGYLCLVNGKYVEAEKFLRRAIDESPTYHLLANANLDRTRLLNRNPSSLKEDLQ